MTRNPAIEPWTAYVAPLMALGVAGAAAAAAFAPKFYAPALAATGGAMVGAHVALERRISKNKKTEEAFKVGKVFTVLYESNKGIVSPVQLSYHAEITLDKATNFLTALAAQQGGQQVPNENGVVFSFPHPQNVIDALTMRAAQWADQQTDEALRENAQLRQTVVAFQSMMKMQAQTKGDPGTNQGVNKTQTTLKKDKTADNPWNNLL
jgi:hypothetical protein